MGSPWKAISDGNRRKILMLLKKRDMNPTAIAKHFDFTLPGLSAHLRILKDANLVIERKQGQHVIYSLNKKGSVEMIRFFVNVWGYESYAMYFKQQQHNLLKDEDTGPKSTSKSRTSIQR